MSPVPKDSPKYFWQMSKEEIDDAVEAMGLTAWREKVNRDRARAPSALASAPNPWGQPAWDVRQQNIIASLAPDVAARMQDQVGYTPPEQDGE